MTGPSFEVTQKVGTIVFGKIVVDEDSHDRWIILDYGLPTEQAYHCGASSKDAGKKLCAINKIENSEMIHPVIDKLLSAPDKQI